MSDELAKQLRGLGSDSPPVPSSLLAKVRAESGRLRRARQRSRRRHVGLTGFGAAVFVAFALTPPGRAATNWVAELAGIGEEPTLNQTGSVPGSAVVVDSGDLADGTPFEVVAKRVVWPDPDKGLAPGESLTDHAEGRGETDGPILLCFQVDFPTLDKQGQGGHCTDGRELGDGLGSESASVYRPADYTNADSVSRSEPALFMGIVEAAETAEVRVFSQPTTGAATELRSRFVPVDPRVARDEPPVGVFVAPLDAETVEAGDEGALEVRAVAYDADGQEHGRTNAFFRPPACEISAAEPAEGQQTVPRPVSKAERAAMEDAIEAPC